MSTLYRLVGVLLSVYASCSAMFGDGKFWVAGEGLLWRATTDASYYTIVGPETSQVANSAPKGNQLTYCPDYRGAYRIAAGYRWCDMGLSVSWASFNTTYIAKTRAGEGQSIFITETLAAHPGGNPQLPQGTALVWESFNYNVLNGDFGRWMRRPCACFVPHVAVGVRYSRIDWKRNVQYWLNTGRIWQLSRIRSDNQGVGPRAVLGGRFEFLRHFGAVAEGAVNILIGHSKGYFYSDNTRRDPPRTTGEIWTVHNKPYNFVSPVLDVRFGFDASADLCGCLTARVGVGYELSHYWNGISRDVFNSGRVESANIVHPKAFSVDGWYFRLAGEY